jgi:hypothetical protein
MRFELFESDGSKLCKNIYARTQIITYDHVRKNNNNFFFTLWHRGAILLAEMCVAGMRRVRKMADARMLSTWLVSLKLNTPRI